MHVGKLFCTKEKQNTIEQIIDTYLCQGGPTTIIYDKFLMMVGHIDIFARSAVIDVNAGDCTILVNDLCFTKNYRSI